MLSVQVPEYSFQEKMTYIIILQSTDQNVSGIMQFKNFDLYSNWTPKHHIFAKSVLNCLRGGFP